MAEGRHIFGPVASRRLGRSLGVDIVPLKMCTQNCIYCQLGIDGEQTLERKEYVAAEVVLAELKERIATGVQADFVTLSGSGEPTLNSAMGKIIDGIRAITDIPVAVITNGTLLSDPAVRADCAKADLVVPSLDAGDAETFGKINFPHKDIDFDVFVEGLCDFRREYSGQMWLEVFLSEGVNDSDEQVDKIGAIIKRIGPDKVQLNTAVRPTVKESALRVERGRLEEIAERLGGNVEVTADYSKAADGKVKAVTEAAVLEMLRRRPCSVADICSGMAAGEADVLRCVEHLEAAGAITSKQRDGKTYYQV